MTTYGTDLACHGPLSWISSGTAHGRPPAATAPSTGLPFKKQWNRCHTSCRPGLSLHSEAVWKEGATSQTNTLAYRQKYLYTSGNIRCDPGHDSNMQRLSLSLTTELIRALKRTSFQGVPGEATVDGFTVRVQGLDIVTGVPRGGRTPTVEIWHGSISHGAPFEVTRPRLAQVPVEHAAGSFKSMPQRQAAVTVSRVFSTRVDLAVAS